MPEPLTTTQCDRVEIPVGMNGGKEQIGVGAPNKFILWISKTFRRAFREERDPLLPALNALAA